MRKISMIYKMPAEWEPHEATWLAWPHNEAHWPGNFSPIPQVFAQIAKAIADSEKVYICVNDEKMEAKARTELALVNVTQKQLKQIKFFHIPTNTSWTRDYGPIFVKDENGKFIITDWIFNTWGGKYPPWDLDDVVPQKIGSDLGIKVLQPGIVLEGGSIEVNGEGTLLTTTQCLLHKNRNPKLSKLEIENYLKKFLGATNVLWLEEGIVGDDTDGHIDDIARFVDKNTILCAVEENNKDENYQILQKNYKDLQNFKDQNGNPFQIITLPMPDPVFYEGRRLPASYINFLITNKSVIVPTFDCPKDEEALNILKKVFPKRKIVAINSVDLIWGLGAIHCSTQQQPK